MTDNDLPLLVDFRREVPTPAEETALRIYRLPPSSRPRRRGLIARRPPHVPRFVVLLVVATLVLLPAALAFGGRIIALFEGTPAPPAVSSNFVAFNQMADMATRNGFAAKFPQADVSNAHGVIEIQTPDGPEHLWVAPNDQGGQCWFIDFADDPPGPSGQQYGFGGCDPSSPPPSNISWGTVWVRPHPSLMTVFGHVYVNAATLQLTLADNSTLRLPIVDGLFLGSLDKGDKVTQLTAYDEAGKRAAQTTP